MERVAPDIHVGDCLFNFRHVTGDTFTSRAADLVVRMLLDTRSVGSVLRVRSVTGQAYFIDRLTQDRVVLASKGIVARKSS
jgi:hypothetical protein